MRITRIAGGPLPTNCYILEDDATGASAVIDPGFESEELTEAVLHSGKVEAILLTHGHFDHISGVRKLQKETGAKVYLSADELLFVGDGALNLSGMFLGEPVAPFRVDIPLNNNDIIRVGNLDVRVIGTPGHTVGGVCFLAEDAMFSGDTLMKLSCGRTDFPTGSYAQIIDSLRRLGELKGDFRVFPGHGSATTLDYERRNNSCMGIR